MKNENPAADKNVATSRFWIIFKKIKKCWQIIGTRCRSLFHEPKSFQIPYTAKINKINILNNKTKNPLELRLV